MQLRRFNFNSALRLREPDTDVEIFNVLGLFLIFWIFFLLNSRFVLPAGVSISLPTTETVEARGTIGVITVQSEKFIIFNGNIFSLSTLGGGIKKFFSEKNIPQAARSAVLLRVEKTLPVEILMKICDVAKKAGYSGVQIASEQVSVK